MMALTTPDPDAVAHHFRQAGDARAYEWLIRAGDRAQDAYAYVVAADRFEAALALLETREATAGERGWLLRRLARLRRYENPQQGIAYLDEALHLARQVGDQILIGNVLVDRGMLLNWVGSATPGLKDMADGIAALQTLSAADRARFQTLPSGLELVDETGAEATLALQLVVAGHFHEARALGERVIDAIPSAASLEAKDDIVLRDGYCGLAQAYAALGLPTRAREAFAHAREMYGAVRHHMMLGHALLNELDQVLIPYYTDHIGERRRFATEAEAAYTMARTAALDLEPRIARAYLSILEGDWAEARQILEAIPYPLGPFPGLLFATVAAWQGDAGTAWQLVREIYTDGPETLSQRGDFLPSNGLQRIAVTLALAADDLPTARAWLEAHDRRLTWSGCVLGQSEGQVLWARYYRAAHDADQAREYARRALIHAEEPRQPLSLVAAHRLLGELDTDAGRHADAATHLATSLALADACAAPYERALSLLAFAELRRAAGDARDALALLDEVRAICTPLGAAPMLARVAALAGTLGTETKRASTYPAGLSAREVEVLRLVADGLTNAQVAERLFISPHTINAHLTTIYAKLAVPSRAAAIRFALDHGLR
jgi:DNA-binding CsgD family transcriptional regulator/tetratricopeptide (TPR) repeat protein